MLPSRDAPCSVGGAPSSVGCDYSRRACPAIRHGGKSPLSSPLRGAVSAPIGGSRSAGNRCGAPRQCRIAWRVDQDFGEPNPSFGGKLHLGEDWNWGYGAQDLGKPIFAIGDGVVSFAGDAGPSWGGVIVIEHTVPSGPGFVLPDGE